MGCMLKNGPGNSTYRFNSSVANLLKNICIESRWSKFGVEEVSYLCAS